MIHIEVKNLLADDQSPTGATGETATTLLARPGARIVRIVSLAYASPEGFWYDQPRDEWVLLVSGKARLRFESEQEARLLSVGDYVFIPARVRHRVDWTSETEPTVWLAVHFD